MIFPSLNNWYLDFPKYSSWNDFDLDSNQSLADKSLDTYPSIELLVPDGTSSISKPSSLNVFVIGSIILLQLKWRGTCLNGYAFPFSFNPLYSKS